MTAKKTGPWPGTLFPRIWCPQNSKNNPALTSAQIGKAIGRSRQTVDSYIADLRAVIQLELDLKLFRMHRFGIPQDRIAKRLGAIQRTISNYLEMPELAYFLKADLSKGFTMRIGVIFKISLP
ncbi:MAG: HTH domain-containing protein [Deltaproteobacteria bacterium]|nr:HTH domain-containing protein [Deltaproteobacteria bacterium]